MPAINHLAPRFLEGSSSGGITATGIGLIVGVGVIPAVALLWIVCWLMICYPHDRTCWCTKSRKRKAREDLGEKGVHDLSQDTLHNHAAHVQRPNANNRTDSGSSNESSRMARGGLFKSKQTRESMQSVGSNSTIAFQQEPKRFV